MSIFGLKQTVLMLLTYEACVTAYYLKITLYRHVEQMPIFYIMFEDDNFFRFQDCICSKFTESCKIDLNCYPRHNSISCQVSEFSNESLSYEWNFPNGFNCALEFDGNTVVCSRCSEQQDQSYKVLFHINTLSKCQSNCVEVGWVIYQEATILNNPSHLVRLGNAEATCATSLPISHFSKTKQTTPSTTSTSEHTTAASVAIILINTSVSVTSSQGALTAELKTNKFNDGNEEPGDDSGNKVPIIVGVTISLIILIAVGLGILLGRRWWHINLAKTSRSSPKEGHTVFSKNNVKNDEKNGAQTYCNLNSDNKGYISDANEGYNTINTEIMNNYTAVNYSNGEFIHKHVEKPHSNVSVVSPHVQNNDEKDQFSSDINFVADDYEYSTTDQHPTETTYSNTRPLELVVSQRQKREPYMNVPRGHNMLVYENDIVKNCCGQVYYQLEATEDNPKSEETTIEANQESPHDTTTANRVYSKLGEQSRHFNNPYNSMSNTDAPANVATVDLLSDIEESNFTMEYSLASNVE